MPGGEGGMELTAPLIKNIILPGKLSNKNSIYCVMLRSSKNADQRKQWWYRVAGYSAVAPGKEYSSRLKSIRV